MITLVHFSESPRTWNGLGMFWVSGTESLHSCPLYPMLYPHFSGLCSIRPGGWKSLRSSGLSPKWEGGFYLECTRQCIECFVWIKSFNLFNSEVSTMLSLYLHFTDESHKTPMNLPYFLGSQMVWPSPCLGTAWGEGPGLWSPPDPLFPE